MMPQKLASRCAQLKASFAAKRLVMLEPGGSLHSFIAFNGQAPHFADAGAGFLVVSFDGQVLVTDGATCESVDALANGLGVEVAFPLPVQTVVLPPPPAK